MDESSLNDLLKESTRRVAKGESGTSDSVLEQLQKAVQEHASILARQEALIKKLRTELKGVER